jgi:hypothetical protein
MGTERGGACNASALEGLAPCSIVLAGAGAGPEPRASSPDVVREPSAGAASAGGETSGADGAWAVGCGREGSGPVAVGRGAGAALGERSGAALGARGKAALGAGGRESRSGAGLAPAANGLDATRGSFVEAVDRWLLSLVLGDDAAARAAALASAFV